MRPSASSLRPYARAFARMASIVGLALFCCAGLRADQVFLRDGRVIDGHVSRAPGSTVVDVRCEVGGMVIVQHIPEDEVRRIVYGASAHEKALDRLVHERDLLGHGGQAADWWRLALEAHAAGDDIMAHEFAQQTITRDRHHVEAHRMLAMVLYRGVWMRTNEVAAAQGDVLYHGRLMSWNERAIAQAADDAKAKAVAERRAAEDEAAYERAVSAAMMPAGDTYLPSQGSNIGFASSYDNGGVGLNGSMSGGTYGTGTYGTYGVSNPYGPIYTLSPYYCPQGTMTAGSMTSPRSLGCPGAQVVQWPCASGNIVVQGGNAHTQWSAAWNF